MFGLSMLWLKKTMGKRQQAPPQCELDKNDDDFTGSDAQEGVNPVNGFVIYYHLPNVKKDDVATLEIKDAAGNIVRSFTSKKDSLYQKWEGGPSANPTLTLQKGLNRLVWNMRHKTMVGVPNVYIEASFNGHKAIPNVYSIVLKVGEQQATTTGEIKANPLYNNTLNDYKEYEAIMSAMENNVTTMHNMVNSLDAKRQQLEQLMANSASDNALKAVYTEGVSLAKKMKAWDEDMIQRRSKAYDDVENFPNKFTAEYLYLINQTESDIAVVNQASLDRKKELDAQWAILNAHAMDILNTDIPALNKKLWELGVGGIWKK